VKNLGTRLFKSNDSRISDGMEVMRNTALLQYIADLAIRVGDDSNPIPLANLTQELGGVGKNYIPISGIADTGDQLIAERVIVQSDLGEQLRVEHPPKAMIGAAVRGHHLVEFILSSTLQIPQVLGVCRMPSLRQASVNNFAIREQEGVADIEEDVFDLSILKARNH
jgi:hypothetical protein